MIGSQFVKMLQVYGPTRRKCDEEFFPAEHVLSEGAARAHRLAQSGWPRRSERRGFTIAAESYREP